jgi:hypothetical protein
VKTEESLLDADIVRDESLLSIVIAKEEDEDEDEEDNDDEDDDEELDST